MQQIERFKFQLDKFFLLVYPIIYKNIMYAFLHVIKGIETFYTWVKIKKPNVK